MKVSIITATYNSSSTVCDTIESVLRQTYQDIEYLIIDGASADNTLDIVKEYEPLFKGRMRYISEPDKGIYDAMNKGIRMASGDVVGILNSDDFYSSIYVVEELVKKLQQTGADAVYGDIHYVNGKDVTKCVRYYSSGIFRRGLMRFGFMPAHPSFYCKREIYNKYDAFDTSYKVAADFENLLRLIFVNHIKIAYLPMDFVTMRTGGASSSGMQSYRQIMRDHLRALHSNKVYSNIFLLGLRYIYKLCEIGMTIVKCKIGRMLL